MDVKRFRRGKEVTSAMAETSRFCGRFAQSVTSTIGALCKRSTPAACLAPARAGRPSRAGPRESSFPSSASLPRFFDACTST